MIVNKPLFTISLYSFLLLHGYTTNQKHNVLTDSHQFLIRHASRHNINIYVKLIHYCGIY